MADRPNNRGRKSRKKVCGFCVDKVEHIDYKDIARLRRFMSESRELKDCIVSSSIYPCVVLGVTVIVVILLFTVFVPRFAGIFADMGRSQPPSMVFLQTASTVMLHACWAVPLTLFAVWSFLRLKFGMEQIRLWRSQLATKIPVFGQINFSVQTIPIFHKRMICTDHSPFRFIQPAGYVPGL